MRRARSDFDAMEQMLAAGAVHGDESDHLAALGAALLRGGTLGVALGQYVDAKLDAGADDLLDG